MKRSSGFAFVVVLTALILTAFGNVSASQNNDGPKLVKSPLAIAPTPTPTLTKGTPTPRRTPPSTKPAPGEKANKARRVILESQNIQAPRQTTAGWQLVYSDGFETGNWPYAPWSVVDLSNDGYDRKWGRSNYWSFWGLFPAAGGAHPVTPPDQYANNMNTRMTYGPFDLSDAKLIDLWFWLWRDIEPCCDYLVFEDGTNFQELGRWSDFGDWGQQVFNLDSFAGRQQAKVAWRFYSDYSITATGPWVDNLEIWKYVPGQVTVRGDFHYNARDGQWSPARATKVYLYDSDPGGTDDLLAVTTTSATLNGNGYFQFPVITNWDEDDTDPDPTNRRLDLYLVWETDTNDSPSARRRVTTFGNWAYQWSSGTPRMNVSDGTADFFNYTVPDGGSQPAMWIFQDVLRAWEYVRNNSSPQTDPGSVTVRWEQGRNDLSPCGSSCFYAGPGGPYVFIAHNDRLSVDAVVHETGHHYMYNSTGWWLWWDVFCYDHNLFSQEDAYCAWSEGWSDFFALVANSTLNPNDTCFDFGIGPCGFGGGSFENLEARNRNDNPPLFPWGDAVEGRVAGALYDLWDNTNEVIWDSATFGFAPIWTILRGAPHETTFSEFWNSWKTSGNNKHHAVRAIYQNTIDYDNAPVITGLPDLTIPKNSNWNNAIDLWVFSSDQESGDSELGWQILAVTDSRCGVTFDGRYVDLAPQTGWHGFCDVTISVSDSIKASVDTFRVTVESAWRIFLPGISK
jgi:hypothetical protein